MALLAAPAPRPLRLATWHAGDGDRVRITPLYRSPIVSLGTFWCAPDDVRWSLENFVGEVAHIIFPATPVWIGTQAALERLAAGDEELAVIARAVGFSSHSHLTASFRRAFGVPPSRVRKRTVPPAAEL